MSLVSSAAGPKRWIYLGLGWLFFGLGFAGAFLPVLPTTPLMILALWCFTKSSPRLQRWLYNHRIFGPALRRWHEHRVIPAAAKMAAVGTMAASLVYLAFFADVAWPVLAAAAALMLVGAVYILSKPSQVREPATGS